MNPWLRRVLILLFVLVWLAILSLPLLAFTLASRQQIQLGSTARIFLIQEKEAEGIGVEWQRPYRPQPNCSQTSVRYLMWVGETENTTYCHCIDAQTGFATAVAQGVCTPSLLPLSDQSSVP
jgi:hypothetical protein